MHRGAPNKAWVAGSLLVWMGFFMHQEVAAEHRETSVSAGSTGKKSWSEELCLLIVGQRLRSGYLQLPQ
jgi:hypothetical protein